MKKSNFSVKRQWFLSQRRFDCWHFVVRPNDGVVHSLGENIGRPVPLVDIVINIFLLIIRIVIKNQNCLKPLCRNYEVALC